MLNKRLMGVVPGCKQYIAQNVALQWCALAANIAMIFMLGLFCRPCFGAVHRAVCSGVWRP